MVYPIRIRPCGFLPPLNISAIMCTTLAGQPGAPSDLSGNEWGHLDTGIVETGAFTEVGVVGRSQR